MTTVIQVSSVLQMTNDYTNTLALLRCHVYISEKLQQPDKLFLAL